MGQTPLSPRHSRRCLEGPLVTSGLEVPGQVECSPGCQLQARGEQSWGGVTPLPRTSASGGSNPALSLRTFISPRKQIMLLSWVLFPGS